MPNPSILAMEEELKGETAATAAVHPLQVQVGGDHYKKFKIQPAEYNHANGINFIEGNIIKYVSRWRLKGGKQDLLKAKHMLELLLALEEEGGKG
jgi:Protein of unknwon function (DUF3310)